MARSSTAKCTPSNLSLQMPDRLPRPSELALIPKNPSQRRRQRTVICLATVFISFVGPDMAPMCMLLSVLSTEGVADDKPSRRSMGFWTAVASENCTDDGCVDDNTCLLLLLLCKLSPPLLGAEQILCRFLFCMMGAARGMLLTGASC